MAGALAGDRVDRAVDGVVDVVLEEENEVACALLRRRDHGVDTEGSTCGNGVADEANVAGALSDEQGAIAIGGHGDDRVLVHDVAAVAVPGAAVVEGKRGPGGQQKGQGGREA